MRVRSREILAWGLFVTLIAGSGCERGADDDGVPAAPIPPPRPELARAALPEVLVETSVTGLHRVELRPEDPAADRATIHSWLLRIEDREGRAIQPSRIAFSGGMPQHAHGFQTAPRVTEALEGGWYRIGGIRFHMAGAWTLRVEFVAPDGPDVAVFELVVPN